MVQDGCEVGPVARWVVEQVLAGPQELAALEQRRQEQEHLLPANNNTHSMRTTMVCLYYSRNQDGHYYIVTNMDGQ